jgi:hypothetical protein
MSSRRFAEVQFDAYAAQNGDSTGDLYTQKLRFYNDQLGENYRSWQEAEVAYLQSQTGSTTTRLPDLWIEFIVQQGVPNTNNHHEMLYNFFLNVGFQTADTTYNWIWSDSDNVVWSTSDNATLLST